MADAPTRIQLSRAAGWRMPPNTVKVDRTTRWGNPFTVTEKMRDGRVVGGGVCGTYVTVPTVEDSIECFRLMVPMRDGMLADIRRELRGKNLACWCRLGTPCHADVLPELANASPNGAPG